MSYLFDFCLFFFASVQPEMFCYITMVTNLFHLQVIPVYGAHQLELELTVFNDDGLVFDNFTSLEWAWSSTDHTHLSVNDKIVHHGNHGNC